MVPGARPVRAAETAVAPEPAAIEAGVAVAVEPYAVVAPYSKLAVVVTPPSSTVPLSVAPVVPMLVAALVVADVGGPNFITVALWLLAASEYAR